MAFPQAQTVPSSMPDRDSKMQPRVLVISQSFAPSQNVGGKRFSFLSRFLVKRCDEYHVLAKVERGAFPDPAAFVGNVHRVPAWPVYPPARNSGLRYKLTRAWEEWFCFIDPWSGWLLRAIPKGIDLCRRYRIDVVIVTIPAYSSIVAGTVIAKFSGAKLIIDYRDPMTGAVRRWPAVFGKRTALAAERAAVKSASAAVFSSQIALEEFAADFRDIRPKELVVIHNGFLEFESTPVEPAERASITMVYAGTFYGERRLSLVASALAQMKRTGEISADSFRFRVYSELQEVDHQLIRELEIEDLIEVHARVPYADIKRIMAAADILFLPSGSEVNYAIPFKFYDYLSARRPILAVATEQSSVARLMREVDCGEFATLGDVTSVRNALKRLIRPERNYSFAGAERFRWEHSAEQYMLLIERVLRKDSVPGLGRSVGGGDSGF